MPRRSYRKCSVDGCDGNAVARGMCDLHYRRQRKHGSEFETGRPDDWGKREDHPLYGQWNWIRRSKRLVDERWDDFWRFVTDVGGSPGENYRLYRLDESLPYGPSNFVWRSKLIVKSKSESAKEYYSRYQREYRKKNPEVYRNIELRKRFGIGLEEYEDMLNKQNGVCAICRKENAVLDSRNGRARMLAVDHCHRTNKIRSLLCQYCNQGLGNFFDDPELLEAAAKYLRSHQ